MDDQALSGIVKRVSRWPFTETLEAIIAAIVHGKMVIFARIDHAASARGIGISIPEATVLIYGNPRAGTTALIDAPFAALELPLRVLLQEEGGRVVVAFHPVTAMLMHSGVSKAVAEKLEPGQRLLLDALEAMTIRERPLKPI